MGRVKTSSAIFALAVLGFLAMRADAGVSISASVDKTTALVNSSIQLSVNVRSDTANVPEPSIPQIKGFEIYSQGRSQSITFVNGKVSSSITFTYDLTPRFPGKFTIPPISVRAGGKTYSTKPITVNVLKTAAAAKKITGTAKKNARFLPKSETRGAPDSPVFLAASIDKKKPYVGEQVTLTVRFFTAIALANNPEYESPNLRGFISEDLPPVRNGQTAVNGRTYYYSEIKTALFPLKSGKAEIGRARVKALLQTGMGLDIFDPNFFQKFFSAAGPMGKLKVVESKPITVNVKPLPPDPPESFSGAVGNFRIRARLDRNSVKEGDTFNLYVDVYGSGNLKTVSEPVIPRPRNFKVYDTMTSLSISKKNDIISGKKTFITVMMAKKAGKYEIPPVKFSYFNPKTGRYEELKTPPLKLEVIRNPGARAGAPAAYVPGAGGTTAIENPEISDIQYIFEKTDIPLYVKAAEEISSLQKINLFFFVLAAFCGLAGYVRKTRYSDPGKIRKAAAFRIFKARMDKIRKSTDPESVMSEIYDALGDYISGKTGENFSSMPIRKTIAAIKNGFPGFSAEILENFRKLWEEAEALRFSGTKPSEKEIKEILKRCEATVLEMEKEFEK